MSDPIGSNTAIISAIGCIFGAKGQVLSPGVYADVEVPFNCSIFRGTLLGDQVGNAVVDILICSFPQFDAGVTHPVAGDSITGGTPLSISGAVKGQDTVLQNWLRTLIVGTVLRFTLNSVASIQQVTTSLEVFR